MKFYLALLSVSLLLLAGCSQAPVSPAENLQIGAVIPLTGAASLWGIEMQNGMELAQTHLAEQGIEVELVYEDSKGLAPEAVSSFNKLVNVDGINVITSIYSRVGATLAPLAAEQEVLYMPTLAVAPEIIELGAPYTFRFYPTASGYVDPYFDTILVNDPSQTVAILHVQDDYGASVSAYAQERAAEFGVEVVAVESHVIGELDYRSQLTKIEAENPDVIVLIESSPSEIINVMKQIGDLGIDSEIVDASVILNTLATRESIGESVNGAYTSAFPFVLEETGAEFAADFQEMFGVQAGFAAPYGYDIVMLLGQVSQGEALSPEELAQRLRDLGTYESANGPVDIQESGEINNPLFLAQVQDFDLVTITG